MDPIALAAALAVMGAVVFGMVAVYQLTAHPRSSMQRRLGTMLGDGQAFESSAADFEGLRPTKVGKTPIIASLLQGRAWTAKIAEDLEHADIRLTVSEFVSMRIVIAVFAALVPLIMIGKGPLAIVAMAAAAGVAFMLPNFYVSFAKGRRLKKLETQLIEALSLISNSLKAGFGLLQSFEMASRQMEHPISTEIRRALYDINVGASTEAALHAMAERSGSKDFDIVVTAMVVQQATGGNLSEILDNVAHTMRERVRIRGEIASLTAQQMLTGMIIGGLPFVMAFMFTLISPDYMTPLFNSIEGNVMLGGAVCLEVFGILLIRKILAIEV